MEENVCDREEHDVLHRRQGAGCVDALAYLDELDEHEESEDAFGQGNDHRLVNIFDESPNFGRAEKVIEVSRDSSRVSEGGDEIAIPFEKSLGPTEQDSANPTVQIEEVAEDVGMCDDRSRHEEKGCNRHDSKNLEKAMQIAALALQCQWFFIHITLPFRMDDAITSRSCKTFQSGHS